MVDATNPVTTPSGAPPAQGPDGTLLNQATTTPSTQTDGSTTPAAEVKPETKPDSSQPKPETKPEDKSLLNAKPEGAPEKYADFKIPDGVTIKPEALTEASALFKGMNLPQAQAQSLLDFHAKQMAEAAQAPYRAVTDMKTAWETEVRGEFGKDIDPGGKVNVAISRAIDLLGPTLAPQFREAMDLTLAGSNPAFVKGFAKFAELLSEGTAVKGNNPSPLGQKGPDAKPLSVAQAMYPHLKSASDQT